MHIVVCSCVSVYTYTLHIRLHVIKHWVLTASTYFSWMSNRRKDIEHQAYELQISVSLAFSLLCKEFRTEQKNVDLDVL